MVEIPVIICPSNLLKTLQQRDDVMYPCIYKLLVIGYTLPITSCEAERSLSSLRLTMNHLQSSTLITLHRILIMPC